MLKIKQSENGYWISENWTYLDTYKATIYKRITFDEFDKGFWFRDYEEREWLGNNPFSKSECQRYWLENEKMFVEICVFEREETEFMIHKVITDKYENAKDLIKDLLDLDELYNSIIKTFEEYIDEIKLEEADLLEKGAEE